MIELILTELIGILITIGVFVLVSILLFQLINVNLTNFRLDDDDDFNDEDN